MDQLGEVGWESFGARQVVVGLWKVTDWFRSFGLTSSAIWALTISLSLIPYLWNKHNASLHFENS